MKITTGECSTCVKPAIRTTSILDGVNHAFCGECYNEVRKMYNARKNKERLKLTCSPYPFGNRATFMANLENREIKRKVTAKFVNAVDLKDLGSLPHHRRKHGEI